MIDPVIMNYSDQIRDWGYVVEPLHNIIYGGQKTQISDLSRLNIDSASFYAINPSPFFDQDLMLSYRDRDTALGQSEQLYTARGAQGFGTFDEITRYGVDPANFEDYVLILYDQISMGPVNYVVRPLFTTKATPDFISKSEGTNDPYGLLSIPLYCQIAGVSIDQLLIKKAYIQVNDPNDHALIDEIVAELTVAINDSIVDVSN